MVTREGAGGLRRLDSRQVGRGTLACRASGGRTGREDVTQKDLRQNPPSPKRGF